MTIDDREGEVRRATARLAADRVVSDLLGMSSNERILLTIPTGLPTAFLVATRAALSARSPYVTEIECSGYDQLVAERRLIEAFAAALPDAVLELASVTLYDTVPMRAYLAGGGRVVSLPDLDDASVARVLAQLDTSALGATQSQLLARLKRAQRVEVTSAGATFRAVLDVPGPARHLRRATRRATGFVFTATPMPVVRGQLAFLPGQVSIQGRPTSMHGDFVADAFVFPPKELAKIAAPIRFSIERGCVVRAVGEGSDRLAPFVASRPRVKHVSFGFLPGATFDGRLLEAERVPLSVTIGFGDFPNHVDVIASRPTVSLDGRSLFELSMSTSRSLNIATKRTARRAGVLDLARDLARPVLVRSFVSTAPDSPGCIAFAGACAQEGAWLDRWSGRAIGIVQPKRVRPFALRRALDGADLALIRSSSQRRSLERIDDACVVVPMLARQTLPLAPIIAHGIKGFATNSNASNDLRVMRKEKLTSRSRSLDESLLNQFHARFYVPTLRNRYGSLAGYSSVDDLSIHVGNAELIEVVRDGVAIAATILTVNGSDAQLIQAGLLEGDASLLKARALAATYVFGAVHAAERAASQLGFGGSLPFLRDGVLYFKSKWGGALTPPASDQRYGVLVRLHSPAVRRFLEREPIICLGPNDRSVGVACVTPTTELDRLFELAVCGLHRLLLLLDGVEECAVRDALKARELPSEFLQFASLDDSLSLPALVARCSA